MWFGLSKKLKDEPSFATHIWDLLNATFRTIVLVIGGVYLVWQTILVNDLTHVPLEKVTLLTVIVTVICILTLLLLPKHALAALAVWQIGLVGSITFALYLFRWPEIAFLFIFLPLIDTVTTGWLSGLLVEVLVIGIITLLSQQPWMSSNSHSYSLMVIFGGAFAGLLGWAATNAFIESNHSFYTNYKYARDQLGDARIYQLELKQTEEDLVLANRELARMSNQLKVLYQVAEEARKAKEEFVANVSHELRTPLNMIIGFSEMIPKSSRIYGIQLPQALLADISAIRRNSQHLSELVDDVLDLSHIETGRMALSKEWTSVQDIIEEAKVAVGAFYETKKLYLKTDVEQGLPKAYWDSTRIRQVVLNLLSNAGRFTKQGGVLVKARRDKEDIIISVADTGSGIAPEDLDRLFQPFQQLDASISRQHGGSGLGLSISKQFVEMHGGQIWLESKVGAGTTFYFRLPVGLQPPFDLDVTNSATRWFNPSSEYRIRTRRSKAPVPVALPRYVVLERGKTLQRLLNRYYQGVDVVSVACSKDAEVELDCSPARALIINAPPSDDVLFPYDQLKKLPFRTPVITCWIPGEDEVAIQLGVRRYLVKPVNLDTLLSTLENLEKKINKILIVDDDLEELQLLSRMLQSTNRGYHILQATTGKRGLDLIRQRHPDVVLLDMVMPGMDGFQVLREINRDSSINNIPIIIVSAKDPTGEPIASNELTLMRGGGFSIREVVDCLDAFSEILYRDVPLGILTKPADQATPKRPAE